MEAFKLIYEWRDYFSFMRNLDGRTKSVHLFIKGQLKVESQCYEKGVKVHIDFSVV